MADDRSTATLFTEETYSTATLSPCGRYRYDLTRRWGDGPTLLWVMLNPSTADASEDDPTIRRCIGFSKRDGYGSLTVVNLFAYRATDPKALVTVVDPEGPDNWWHIQQAVRSSDAVVFAWGAAQIPREHHIWHGGALIPSPLCLGHTKKGAPRHPLYVKGDQPFVPYVGARTSSENGSTQQSDATP